MRDERLLERLASTEQQPLRRTGDEAGRLIDSIMDNLRCILNTRQGNVPIAPDFGTPDFMNFLQNYPESVRDIELSIRRTVEHFEPRLDSVQVALLPQVNETLALHFQITARLCSSGSPAVRFETVVGSGGRVSVRR
jgi:type VI secretion system protein